MYQFKKIQKSVKTELDINNISRRAKSNFYDKNKNSINQNNFKNLNYLYILYTLCSNNLLFKQGNIKIL